MSRWPMVPLGEVAPLVRRPVAIDECAEYPELGVRSFGKGTFHKPSLPGGEVGSKKLFGIEAGDLLFNIVFAWEGAVAIATPEDHGRVGSHRFLTCVTEPITASFLRYFFMTAEGLRLLGQASPGGAGRNRTLGLKQLNAIPVPLPSLLERRRIVAKLDAAAERVAASRHRLEQVMAESLLACRDLIRTSVERGGVNMCVGDFMRRRPLDITVQPEKTYDFAGVYSFGRGVFRGERKSGSSFAYSQLTQLRAGDFTYPKLMAWEGALGVVPQDCDGLVVSPEFPVFHIDADTLRPEIADVYFRDPRVWPTLSAGSTGTNMRRRRLNPSAFLDLLMPVPSRSDQERLAKMIHIQRRVVEVGKRSLSDLDTLLPALLAEAFGEATPPTVAAS